MSAEAIVRAIIAAIQADKDLNDKVCSGRDWFTAGDLVSPANALNDILTEEKSEAVAAEREACAKIADDDSLIEYNSVDTATKISAAIRARSNTVGT